MKLREFIEKLKKIEFEQGKNLEVVMADFISVKEPVLLNAYDKKMVIITDEE